MFRYVANIIHMIYGHTSPAAARLNGRNARIIRIATHISAINTINAQPAICAPKNAYDHSAFNTIWTKNNEYARVLLWRVLSLRITKNNATPNSAYKIPHATPNTHPSGVSTDLFNALYQTSDAPCGENIPPTTPGINEIIIATINKKTCFMWVLPVDSVL